MANASRPVALVPPRPNLGPEPMPAAWPWPWAWSGLIVATLAIAVVAAVGLRRRVKARVDEIPSPPGPPTLTLTADELRDALAARFGPGWRARTTEEILGDPAIVALLGASGHDRLDGLLRSADRAKFAGETDGPAPGFDPLIAAIRARAETGAGKGG